MAAKAARKAKAPSRRDEARALFRNAILDAAEEVFAERGFHAARCQDIAARARIAVGTIYNHFGQKEDVLRDLIDERMEQMLATLSPVAGEPKDFEAKLVARLERMFGYLGQHRGFFALALEHGLLGHSTAAARQLVGDKKLTRFDRFKRAWRKSIEEGVEEGVLEAYDVDLLSRFLGGVMRAYTFHTVANADLPSDDAAKMVVNLFMHGAHRRQPAPARPSAKARRAPRAKTV